MHEPVRPHRGPYRLHPTVDEVTRRRVGEPNPRGRLERNLGPFLLREGMTAPGDMPFNEALDLVLVEWNRQVDGGTISRVIIDNYTNWLRGLGRLMTARGLALVSDLSVNFLLMWCLMPQSSGEPASENTSRIRRSAARSFFETAKGLGIIDANPAKSVEFPTRSDRYVRPLSDAQIAQLQRCARMSVDDTRTPAAFALVMSGATTTETSFVTVADVDMPARRVWVHDGGYRQDERWITLHDDWCVAAVQRRLDALRVSTDNDGDPWMVYQPKPTNPDRTRQGAAGGMVILRLLQFARVHQPGVTRAESIREWLAAQVYADTGSLEEVARRLGMSSLDGAAHVVGHNWLISDDPDHQPPAHRVGDQS